MLFPFFALTGLKFVFPKLTASVVYLTKPELTTLTMFYDAYYDLLSLSYPTYKYIIPVRINQNQVVGLLNQVVKNCLMQSFWFL